MKKTKGPNICVRVSPTERTVIEKAARSVDMTLSGFLRRSALAVARRQVTPARVELDTGDTLALAGTSNDKVGEA